MGDFDDLKNMMSFAVRDTHMPKLEVGKLDNQTEIMLKARTEERHAILRTADNTDMLKDEVVNIRESLLSEREERKEADANNMEYTRNENEETKKISKRWNTESVSIALLALLVAVISLIVQLVK